jgi:ABC-type lipoprotein release transport system permease subunit
LTTVVGPGLKLAVAGVVVGLLIAWSAAGVIRSFFFEVEPDDPGTYIAVMAGRLVVTCAAACPPARRAALVDPAQVLSDD